VPIFRQGAHIALNSSIRGSCHTSHMQGTERPGQPDLLPQIRVARHDDCALPSHRLMNLQN
jgi:hypothetical protein